MDKTPSFINRCRSFPYHNWPAYPLWYWLGSLYHIKGKMQWFCYGRSFPEIAERMMLPGNSACFAPSIFAIWHCFGQPRGIPSAILWYKRLFSAIWACCSFSFNSECKSSFCLPSCRCISWSCAMIVLICVTSSCHSTYPALYWYSIKNFKPEDWSF